MLIVITAGGVKEKIDNVRNITNSSSGKLGAKIAKEFLTQDEKNEIIYIHGDGAVTLDDNRIQNIKIRDTQSLLDAVTEILTRNKVDVFVHSMAVADYTTSCVVDMQKFRHMVAEFGTVDEDVFDILLNRCTIENDAKISSNIEKPAVVLKKTPKVIEHIKKLSPYTFLVGFKLLDSVSEDELFNVGFDLLRKNRCNLVLANDINQIRAGNHRGMIIYPEKTYDIANGKDDIANMLVAKIVDRYNVGHPKSIQVSDKNLVFEHIFRQFKEMGLWLNQSNFLPVVVNHDRPDKYGTYGNLSMKDGEYMYITCRNVDKARLKVGDISRIDKVDIFEGENIYSNVYYNSAIKPSIDTTIHSQIYKYSKYNHIVHIHTNRVFLGYPLVDGVYPCGCDKECNAIVEIVKNNPDTHVVQMKKHGLIILANSFDDCTNVIYDLFTNTPYINYDSNVVSVESRMHIADVNPSMNMFGFTHPLMIGHQDIGFVYERIDENINFGLFTMENVRGKGLNIVKKYLNLYDKDYVLHTTVDCEIADFYKNKYGFADYNLEDERDLQYILKKKEDRGE